MAYVSTAGSPEAVCVFCAALAAGDDRRAFILKRGRLAFLILNAFPYASGHLMAVVTRHVGTLEAATTEELGEAMALIQSATRALGAAYHPDGFNVGLNQGRVAGAGVLGHLHVHLVPRWNGDTNFMSAIGETRVLPEALEATYDRLAAALAP
ncbi:MAG TPA: HIT domain-containing protein [Methylomirabilota bacterium]|jgi:ATP adenylyltransferase|nr:HIT domain-containing protein [Methylomirabilota bacterium]